MRLTVLAAGPASKPSPSQTAGAGQDKEEDDPLTLRDVAFMREHKSDRASLMKLMREEDEEDEESLHLQDEEEIQNAGDREEEVGDRKEVEEAMEDLGGLHLSKEEEDGSSDDEEERKQYSYDS